MIDRFRDSYKWLSNFHEAEVIYDNIIYPTVEHYYVALKVNEPQSINIDGVLTLFNIQELRKYISKIETPGKVKKFGNYEIKVRKDWDDMKVSVMRYGLVQKFSKEPFKSLLVDTYPMLIVENNDWKDSYWGVYQGVGKKCIR